MKRKDILLVILAFALVLSMGIGSAYAYFTSSASASGGLDVSVKPSTDITEPKFDDQTKHVVISNAIGAEPVYVRARFFSSLPVEISGTKWSAEPDEDGWYVYSEIIPGGEQSEELLGKITFPADAEDGDNYNIVVVYEATPVQYDADGNPLEPDWTLVLDDGMSEGGN